MVKRTFFSIKCKHTATRIVQRKLIGQPATIYGVLKDGEPLSREKEGELLERLENNQKVTDKIDQSY